MMMMVVIGVTMMMTIINISFFFVSMGKKNGGPRKYKIKKNFHPFLGIHQGIGIGAYQKKRKMSIFMLDDWIQKFLNPKRSKIKI